MPLSKARTRAFMRNLRAKPGICNDVIPSLNKFLSIDERLILLAEMAREGNRKLVNPVEAIKEYNRMTGAYPPVQHQVASKVVFLVEFKSRRSTEKVVEITPITPEVAEEETSPLTEIVNRLKWSAAPPGHGMVLLNPPKPGNNAT